MAWWWWWGWGGGTYQAEAAQIQQQAVDLGLDLSHATLEKGELQYPGKAEELALREKLRARGQAADNGEEYEGTDDTDDEGGREGGDGENEGGAEVGATEASSRGAALFQRGVETVEQEAS
jgi:hypothetical protein